MIIRIEGERFQLARSKGKERFLESREDKRQANEYSGFDDFRNIVIRDIQGSIAEVAVADFLGIKDFSPTVNNFPYFCERENKWKKDPDIEPNIEVRSVQCHSAYPNKRKSLILREKEGIEKKTGSVIEGFFKRKFILAITHYDEMEEQVKKGYIDVDIVGWSIGEDVMIPKYIMNPNKDTRGAKPAYFVPIRELLPFTL
jgi:hypothetical protein